MCKVKCSLSDVIERAKLVHGDKYNYTKMIDADGKTYRNRMIVYTCNACNHEMTQILTNHLGGNGCYNCNKRKGGRRRITFEEVVRRGNIKHDSLYEYKELIPPNTITRFKSSQGIRYHCPKCNRDVEQRVSSHLSGHGCKRCNAKISNLGGTQHQNRRSLSAVRKKGKKVHGDIYEYIRIIPNDDPSVSRLIVYRCTICDMIRTQRLNSHLSGSGCKKCKVRKAGIVKRHTLEGVALCAAKTHNDKYEYLRLIPPDDHKQGQMVEYKCKRCGNDHTQRLAGHLSGQGCPTCSRSHHDSTTAASL